MVDFDKEVIALIKKMIYYLYESNHFVLLAARGLVPGRMYGQNQERNCYPVIFRIERIDLEDCFMNIALVWSSPNMDGLTAAAKDNFISGIKRVDGNVEEIHLNKENLGHCRACGDGWGICRSQGHCVIKDDFEVIYQKLVKADGIVFVSAVYWHDITECMKAFIDRLRRCETTHNGYLAGKRCFLVACAGGTGLGAIECLHKMEEALKHMGMRAYDRIPVVRFNKDYMLAALVQAGEIYSIRLKEGFDMQY